MMFFEGLSCPVCQKPFVETDDVVACPKCGLPHHRSCWKIENHCQLEDLHDTDVQWSRDKQKAENTKGHIPPDGEPANAQVCPHCYTRNAEFAEFCSHCGREMKVQQWQSPPSPANEYRPFRAYPPVENYSPQEKIGDCTAGELAAMVGNNTTYYMPRFRKIAQNGNAGWNWAAFLMGSYWLIYRKQYVLGFFMLALELIMNLASAILSYPVNYATTEAEVYQMAEQMRNSPMFMPLFVLMTILFVVRILLGLRGTELYLSGCSRKIRKAKSKVSDLSPGEMTAMGGVSIGVVIISYFATNAIVNLFVTMLLS